MAMCFRLGAVIDQMSMFTNDLEKDKGGKWKENTIRNMTGQTLSMISFVSVGNPSIDLIVEHELEIRTALNRPKKNGSRLSPRL